MKRVTLLAVLVLAIMAVVVSVSPAQNAYMKGNQVIHGGLGFGLAGIYGDATLPPIVVGYEFGYDEKISIGGMAGYAGSSYKGFGWEWNYSYILFGARGAYHFIEKNDKLDAYGGLLVGYNIVSVSETGTAGFGFSAGSSYLLWGLFGGARYYLSPQLAVYGELGYGAGLLTLGVAYKL